MFCTLDGCGDKFVELVVVDAPVVRSVGGAEDSVGDVGADLVGDGFRCAFFCANDGLIDHVDAVSFVLGVGTGGDGRAYHELGGGLRICDGARFVED